MPDSPESANDRKFSWPLKAVVVSVAGILVSLGLCGVNGLFGGRISGSLAGLGAFGFVISVFGLIGSLVALAILAIAQSFKK